MKWQTGNVKAWICGQNKDGTVIRKLIGIRYVDGIEEELKDENL